MKTTITFDEFLKVDIRVGTVTHAESVPKSKKLLKLKVSFGPEIGERTIMAGIAEHYNESIIGLKVVAVINLMPRTMMGVESHGMLLAGHGPTNSVVLLNPGDIVEGNDVG